MSRIAASDGVHDVRLSERTANVLIEFDPALIDEPGLLNVIAGASASDHASHSITLSDSSLVSGWLRAGRSETMDARPVECVAVLLEFERYPEWQSSLSSVTVLERDQRGRGTRVAMHGSIGGRDIRFVATYRFPSPNRVVFEQADGELDAVRGGWTFRSLGGGRTRATYRLEVMPGWRLGLLLRGTMFEQLREAVLDQIMSELRGRVETRTE